MFGFLKNLLRRSADDAATSQPSAVYEADPSPSGHYDPDPAPPPAQPRAGQPQQNGKGLELPLQSVINSLPLELQPRVRMSRTGNMTITVPLEKVLAQLSRGAVKISFGELRQAVPEVFTNENDRDRVLIALPLAEILSRLSPNLISRRRVQRQVQVPSDISSPFEGEGNGLAISTAPSKPEPPPMPAPPRQTAVPPAPHKMPGRGTLTSAPTPAAPAALPMPAAPRLNAKSAPPAPPVPRAPAPAAPAVPRAPAPQPPPAPIPFQPAPVTAKASPQIGARPEPIAMPGGKVERKEATPQDHIPAFQSKLSHPKVAARPEPPPAPVPQVAPTPAPAPEPMAPPPAPHKPVTMPEPIMVTLTALADGWPDPIRKEIVEMKLVDAKVALPLNAAEQGLKQGRIAFSWKTIRSWIRPAVPPAPGAHDGNVLELPLKVVAPLFLARQRDNAKPHQKVSIDEDIPNLFFGFPQAEGAVPVAQATARPADTNFYVWDDANDMVKVHEAETRRGPTPGTKFVAKYATPNEVVSRAAGLDGVTGALIALPDGLMVANRLPPDVNADTLAAFLPQIFGKVSQCTKELRMGDLNNLNFTVGNVPWKIFRVNSIFFAAFGRAGEPLPTAQLAALAAELDHNPK